MNFKDLLTKELRGKIKKDDIQFLPSGFQIIGNIAIVEIKPQLRDYETDIGKIILNHYKYIKTVCKKDGIYGAQRRPKVKIIAGRKNFVTVHKEHGCLFKMDVSKVMFAKGNVKERGRLINVVKDGETIVDMFAGIGYFSIPIAKNNPSCHIYAIDINRDAIFFLKENCILNKVFNIEIIEGDCREISKNLFNIADRVIMGYLPNTYNYLVYAFRFLKNRGIIHYHDVYREHDLWKNIIEKVKEAAVKSGYKLNKVLYKSIVKSYAPRQYHIVTDMEFLKNSQRTC